jgi:hypothetical protein
VQWRVAVVIRLIERTVCSEHRQRRRRRILGRAPPFLIDAPRASRNSTTFGLPEIAAAASGVIGNEPTTRAAPSRSAPCIACSIADSLPARQAATNASCEVSSCFAFAMGDLELYVAIDARDQAHRQAEGDLRRWQGGLTDDRAATWRGGGGS